MVQSLYELLRRCTVRVSFAKKTQGTGFFVAPGLILTCAHVVEEAQKSGAVVDAYWNSQSYPAQIKELRATPYPDIALLQVNLTDHPCVYLSEEAKPFDRLYCYGYPDDYPNGDSATFDCEGWTDDQQPLLKLKQGQVRPGLSGAPLLNIPTGRVCGIVKRTRNRDTDLGGRAVPTKTVLREFGQLAALQQEFHQRLKDWASGTTSSLEIFYSYAHKDEDLREDLETHLSLLKRQKLITGWHDHKIGAGKEFKGEIDTHLNTAHIVLLLVSPAFMASDYCFDKEMMRAMERHETGDARVIPIILRPVDWHEAPFAKLKALPKDGKPVTMWSNHDEAFLDVAKGIRGVVEELTKNPR